MNKCFKISKFLLLALFLFSFNLFGSTTAKIENWKQSAFGDIGGQNNINSENFKFEKLGENSVRMTVLGNRGKIAGSSDGLFFFYDTVEKDSNFILSAKLRIEDYNINNQVSFGLMVRDEVLDNQNDARLASDYIALGPLRLAAKADASFYRKNGNLERKGLYDVNPMSGDTVDLTLRKSGDIYILSISNQEDIIIEDFNFSGPNLYVGLFVARNAKIVFEDISLVKNISVPKDLKVNNSKGFNYLLGQDINLDDINVTAIYSDGTEKKLDKKEYIVTNFSNEEIGKRDIVFNYNGAKKKVEIELSPLTLTKLEVEYYPAKTEYYIQDSFKEQGLVMKGFFNKDYKIATMDRKEFEIYIDGKLHTEENPYTFTKNGIHKVKVVAIENRNTYTEYNLVVRNARLSKLEIRENPAKMQYFIDDTLDLDGLIVYAIYSDKSEIRLLREELTLGEFNSKTPGNKTVRISHKNQRVNLRLHVKRKEAVSLLVTNYPKTTYSIGEELNLDNLEISVLYDNGDLEKITNYNVNKTKFNKEKAGEYDLIITSEKIKETTLPISVRERINFEWKEIVFGQSISPSRNFIKSEKNKVTITALEGGGKITGDHDGISFYYVELDAEKDNFVLSADIKVLAYAKNPHDGQESFGIMARDAIGTNMDSAVFASNLGAIGGFSGGTRDTNGTQLYVRTGVESADGAGSKGIEKIMINPLRPNASNTPYRLTLIKNNSGFAGKIDNGEEVTIFEPQIMNIQDKKMYVGFYAARLATIEVSNIDLKVTSSKTDAPKIEKEVEAIKPLVAIESLRKTSDLNYNLVIKTNVKGYLSVKIGNKFIISNKEVEANKRVFIESPLEADKNNKFSIVFLPDDTQFLTNYSQIVENFSVEMKRYQTGKDIYVSPQGTSLGDGSYNNPLDLDTAIDFVQAGQKIILKAGHYLRDKPLIIARYNDGKEDARKYLFGEKGSRPVIDFGKRSEGVIHSGDYWHIYNIDFARSAPNTKGYTIGGNHNIIELSRFYEHGDTGLQISRTDLTATYNEWPSYNLILNCTSFDNRDPAENNADGFAAKLTSGVGNIFDGCIAHNNIDDGWDLYAKIGTGAIGAVTIRNSVAYNNGYLKGNKPGSSAGDGNGFKLGGEGIHVPHLIENSLAFGNTADGFTSNSNPGLIVKNNVSYNNGRNAGFSTYGQIKPDFKINNFISFYLNSPIKASRDFFYPENHNETNFIFDGKNSRNSLGKELNKELINNLKIPEEILRKKDGTVDFDFLFGLLNSN